MQRLRKLIDKVMASNLFTLISLVIALTIGLKLHNYFCPTEEPIRQVLEIKINELGTSVQSGEVVSGVQFTWDFLKQEMVIENNNNEWATIAVNNDGIDAIKFKPHERMIFPRQVAVGSKFDVRVEVGGIEDTRSLQKQFFVLGYDDTDRVEAALSQQ